MPPGPFAEGNTGGIMTYVSLGVYCSVLGVILSFIIWLFSIRWFRKVRVVLRLIPWTSPATWFVILITTAMFST